MKLNPMSPTSPINLTEPDESSASISQLYRYIELFSEGEPPRHSLFVLGRPPLADFVQSEAEEELLIVDPPLDVTKRFRLIDRVAVLFTGAPEPVGLPLMQTVPNGVAHVRIGEHFVDVYSFGHSNIVHLPAVGLLCSGNFGSNTTLPALAPNSDGQTELDALIQLARLIKQHRIQLFIPRLGEPAHDEPTMLQRLASDVAYLHQLRRVVPGFVGQATARLMQAAETLLPPERRGDAAQAVNRANLTHLLTQMSAR